MLTSPSSVSRTTWPSRMPHELAEKRLRPSIAVVVRGNLLTGEALEVALATQGAVKARGAHLKREGARERIDDVDDVGDPLGLRGDVIKRDGALALVGPVETNAHGRRLRGTNDLDVHDVDAMGGARHLEGLEYGPRPCPAPSGLPSFHAVKTRPTYRQRDAGRKTPPHIPHSVQTIGSSVLNNLVARQVAFVMLP